MLSHEQKPTELIDYQKQFFLAAAEGDIETVKKLYEDKQKKIDLNSAFNAQATALYMAAQNGHLAVINYLLSLEEIDVNKARRINGFFPLFTAVGHRYVDIVKAFLTSPKKSQIDVDAQTSEGYTALYFAAQEGYVELMKLLLEAKADPNIECDEGLTPLDAAIYNGHHEASLLLDGFKQKLHSSIIQRMVALGFKSHPKGICFGFAEVAKLCALSGKQAFNHFHQTLFLLKKLKIEDLLKLQSDHNSKQIQAAQEKQYMDILSLFNAIELEHQGCDYSHLYEKRVNAQVQNPSWVTPLVQPALLEKKGGECIHASFTGAYTAEELSNYFSMLRKRVIENKNVTQPIALTLTGCDHRICVLYDPIDDTWEVLDVNKFPSDPDGLKEVVLSGDTDISHVIAEGLFSSDASAIFQTSVSTAKDMESFIKPVMTRWQEDIAKLHLVTPEKAKFVDGKNATWLYIAAKSGDIETVKSLVAQGADINGYINKDNVVFNPLNIAVQNGHAEVVKFLLSQTGIKTNKPNQNGYPPFVIAAECGYTEVIKLFLEAEWEESIDYNATSNEGVTALHLAAQEGFYDIVELLLKEKNIDLAVTKDGDTALGIAGLNNHFDIFTLILKERSQEIDPNQVNKMGCTLLGIAVEKGRLDIVKLLLQTKFKTKIDVSLNKHCSALYFAVQNKHFDIMNVLIEAGADVNSGFGKWTPAYKAAKEGQAEFLKVLIQHGADLNIPDEDGWTPAYAAAINDQAIIVEVLAEAKADMQKPDNDGWAPIHIAAQCGSKEVIQVLVNAKYNLDIDLVGSKKYTAACLAAIHDHVDILDILAKAGANLQHECEDGTPLMMAVKLKKLHVIKWLFDHNVNPLQEDQAKHTALYYALSNECWDIADLLLKHAALDNLNDEDKLLIEKNSMHLATGGVVRRKFFIEGCGQRKVEAVDPAVKPQDESLATTPPLPTSLNS